MNFYYDPILGLQYKSAVVYEPIVFIKSRRYGNTFTLHKYLETIQTINTNA